MAITPVDMKLPEGVTAGDPFDAVVHDATSGDGVDLIYLPFDEATGKVVAGAAPQTINTDDIFQLEVY